MLNIAERTLNTYADGHFVPITWSWIDSISIGGRGSESNSQNY